MNRARRLIGCTLAGLCLSHCSSTSDEVFVSVRDQRMGVYSEGKLQKQYVISTSKFGVGDQPGTYRTPLGKLEIVAKIGHGLPTGAVLKSRSWNGEVLKPNAPGRDPIVSRILWLRGMERDNRNAYGRYIYIHGTTEENRLGTPASYGCIRMGMKDVVDLFNELPIGAKVNIITEALPKGKKVKVQREETPEADDGEAQAGTEAKDKETETDAKDASSDLDPAPPANSASVKAVPIPVTTTDGENLPDAPAGADPAESKQKRGIWPFRRSEKTEEAPETAPTPDERTVPADQDATPQRS